MEASVPLPQLDPTDKSRSGTTRLTLPRDDYDSDVRRQLRKHAKYKVKRHLGRTKNESVPIVTKIGTASSFSLESKDLLRDLHINRDYILPHSNPNHSGASKNTLDFLGIANLYVTLENVPAAIVLSVIRSLPKPVVFGTRHYDAFRNDIRPRKRVVVFQYKSIILLCRNCMKIRSTIQH